MKKIGKILTVLLSVWMINACISDQEVTTTFKEDGSLSRVVTFTSDEEDFDLADLNIPVDSTWRITVMPDSADSSKYFVRCEKNFNGVEELNRLYDSLPHNFTGIDRKVTWEKKFRWFYTYFHYTETIKALFHQRPMTDFLNEEEIRFALATDEEKDSIFSGLDSTAMKELEERVDEKGWRWISACTFDELYQGLLKTADQHPQGNFNRDNLERLKDTLYATFDNVEDSLFKVVVARETGITDIDSLVEAWPENFESYRKLEDIVGRTFGEEYMNHVRMPGDLVFTNAEKTNEGLLSWKIGSLKYLGNDFVMEAVSRKVHPWAFIIAGIILIIALVMWFAPAIRKKQSNE